MPAAAPRCPGGTAPITADAFGEENSPEPIPLSATRMAKTQYGKSTGSTTSPAKLAGHDERTPDRERPGAEVVGQPARNRPGEQEAQRQRQQVDAGPQRGLRVVVPVQRQPDPLQPDDQHELHAAPADRGQQAGQVAEGERAITEQAEVEHRLGDPGLDEAEGEQQGDAAAEAGQYPRVGPAGGVAAVGLDAVRDGGEHRGQADREGDVARPVQPAALAGAQLVQRQIGPDGAEDPDRHADPEHRPPVPFGQHAAEYQADERAGDRRHLVDAQRHAALPGRERVGEDRGGVGEHHRAADRLYHPPADQPQRTAGGVERVDGQCDRGEREDHKPEVVQLDPAVHVAKPAQRHHQYRRDQQEPHQDPEQVADVAGSQRVEMDAVEDRRQRDDHDRRVDRGQQHAQRRVGQRDPLVPGMVTIERRHYSKILS